MLNRNELKLQKDCQNNQNIVFGVEWFKKHQNRILWLLNIPIIKIWFRWILKIHSYDLPLSKKIIDISPNNFSFDKHSVLYKGKYYLQKTTDFRTHDKYSKRLYFAFKPFWYLLHFFDWTMLDRVKALTKLSFGFSTLTVYPDAGTGATTVDGGVERQVLTGYGEIWGTIRVGAGTHKFETGSQDYLFNFQADNQFDKWIILDRWIATFDTSALTSSATISAAVLSVYVTSKSDALGDTPDGQIYTSTPTNNNSLLISDFGQIGTIAQCDLPITYANFTTSAYNDFIFNATGRGNISKTGISKFAAKNANYDNANVSPGWSSLNNANVVIYAADQTGTITDPKLVITYTIVISPTVTTQAVTNKATTSGTGNGNITDTGGANATRRGFCYMQGTSGDPTTANSVAYDDGDFGIGAYTKEITGLTNGTSYRVRAYANNSAGTGYGTTVDYKTAYEKILTQALNIISIMPNKMMSRTFTQPVNIISLELNQTGKIFIETLRFLQVFLQVGIFSKTLTEIIKIISIRTAETGKIFKESLNINALFTKILTATRILSETIKIAPIFIKGLTAFKILIENIVIISTKILIGYKVLIENIKIVSTFLKIGIFIKTLNETIQILSKNFFTTLRIFTERIIITSIYLRVWSCAKLLTESIKIIGSVFKNAGRTFIQSLKIIDLSVNMQIVFIRTLTETVKIISLMGSFIISKLFIQSIKIISGLLNQSTFFKILNETIKITDQIIKTINKIFIEIIKVISKITQSISRLFSENIKIISKISNQTARMFIERFLIIGNIISKISRIFTERIIVGIIFQTILTSYKIFTETIKIVSVKIILTTKIFIERVIIIQQSLNLLRLKIINEIIKISSSFLTIFQRTCYESIKIIGQLGSWTIGKLLVAPIKIIASYLSIWTLTRTYQESIKIISELFKQSGKIFLQVIKIISTIGNFTIGKLLTEIIKINSLFIKTNSKTFTQIFIITGAITRLSGKIFSEIIKIINPNIIKAIGKVLIGHLIISLEKIKLVLNGVQVGWWKKIARIKGLWHKINRNDN